MKPNIRFGFMLFDDPSDPTSGWSAIAGEPSNYINNVSSLDTDTLWWSNLSYKDMYIDSKVGMSAIMRHDRFLILSPNDCLTEWGYDPKTLTQEWIASFVSRVFDKIMKMAWDMIVAACKGIHPKDVFSGRDLRQDMSRIFPEPEWPVGEAAAVCKSGYGYTEYTTTMFKPPKGYSYMRLGRNRLSHALDIMTTPIPNGKMEFISGAEIGDNAKNKVMNSNVPWMAEVAVKNINPDVSTVLAFGTSMDKTKRIIRTWVPHPELIAMNPLADIEIRNAYKGEGYTTLANSLPDSVIEFMNDQFSFLSWSAGVLAETLWKSATLKNPKADPSQGMIPDTSWRGLWIKSTDKALSFIPALAMNEMGWKTSSYGAGSGFFSCPEHKKEELIKEAGLCGLLPRLVFIPENFNGDSYTWNGDKRAAIFAKLTAMNNRGILWNMDKLPTYPVNERPEAFKKIIHAAKEKKI